jgi:hypothetical protein
MIVSVFVLEFVPYPWDSWIANVIRTGGRRGAREMIEIIVLSIVAADFSCALV